MERRVLIIEDNEKLAQALKLALARRNLPADIAGDGIAALKAYAATVYHLLVLDIQLPRLNGIEVLKKVRQTHRGATLPVIIVTGVYKGDTYAQRARAMYRVHAYLEKPFTLEAFLQAVSQALGLPAPAEQARPAAKPAAAAAEKPASPAAANEKPAHAAPATAPAARPAAAQHPSPPAMPPAPPPVQPQPVAAIQPVAALKGRLQDMSFDLLLSELFFHNQSGVLHLKRNGEERRVYFVEGVPLAVKSSRPESGFGHYLLQRGKVSLREHQAYEERRARDPEREPFDLFLKMGCLKLEEYHLWLRRYIEDWLIELFGWEEGEFVFQAQHTFLKGADALGVNVPRLFHEGYKLHLKAARQNELFHKYGQRYLALTPAFYDYQMHLNLSHTETVFLDGLDGNKTLLELAPGGAEECAEVLKTLMALSMLGMVEDFETPHPRELAPPFPIREVEHIEPKEEEVVVPAAPVETEEQPAGPKPEPEKFLDLAGDLGHELDNLVEGLEKEAPLQQPAAQPADEAQQRLEQELKDFAQSIRDKNYYEMFGMTPNTFEFAALKQRYFELQRKFSPDKFLQSSGEVLAVAEEVLAKLASAYNTLSNVVSKEKYDEMLPKKAAGLKGDKDHDKMQAEVAYHSGMSFLQMEDWDAAEKSFQEAMDLDPQVAEYRAHYAYAIYMKNRRAKAAAQKAQELLQQALRLKPKCAVAFAYRGAILFHEDKISLAEADYQKALSLNPRLKMAIKGLKLIEQKKQSEKKGLLGRFKK